MVTWRDGPGEQWALRIAKAIERNPELVEKRLREQALSYAAIGRSFQSALNLSEAEAASKMRESGYKFAGWSKRTVLQSLYGGEFPDLIPTLLDEPAEHLPDPKTFDITPDFLRRWNKAAQAQKIVRSADFHGYSLDSVLTQARRRGVLSEVESILGSKAREATAIQESLVRKAAKFVGKHKVAVGVGIAVLLAANIFSGRDDEWNTIEGLTHDGIAGQMRSQITDFGSGYQGSKEEKAKWFWINRAKKIREHTRSGYARGGKWHEKKFIKRYRTKERANTIEALRHEGVSGASRSDLSDFGSGWTSDYQTHRTTSQKLTEGLPSSLMGQPIDPRILKFRKEKIDVSSERKAIEEEIRRRSAAFQADLGEFGVADLVEADFARVEALNRKRKDLKAVRLDRFKIEVEDADTLILKRRGLVPQIESFFDSGDTFIRLAGIDAPEVEGHKGDPLAPVRIWQDQPGGEESAWALKSLLEEQDNVNLLISEKQKTYGRYLGVLTGDEGVNLNLELIRRGAVSALPFGPRSTDILTRNEAEAAEETAFAQREGMWSSARYQATHLASENIGQAITHNTLTRLDKLSSNLNLGAYSSFLESLGSQERELTAGEVAQARRMGRVLRKTHGPAPWKNKFSGKDDAYNEIEGLGHKGIAWQKRRQMTDFGSGLIRMALGGSKALQNMSRSEMYKKIHQWLKKEEVGLVSGSVSRGSDWTKTFLKNYGGGGGAVTIGSPRFDKFGIAISSEIDRKTARPLIIHEASEVAHAKSLNKMSPKRELLVSPRFSTHMSPGVIAEEAILSAKLGPEYFKYMKGLRLREKEAIFQLPREGRPRKRWLLSKAGRERFKVARLTKNIYEQDYLRRVERIYESVEKKWIPRFLETNNKFTGFAHEQIKGISEGVEAKAMRKKLDIPFESAWIKAALKKGIAPGKIAQAAGKLTPEKMNSFDKFMLMRKTMKSQIEGPGVLDKALKSYRSEVGVNIEKQFWVKGSEKMAGGIGQQQVVYEAQGTRVGLLKTAKNNLVSEAVSGALSPGSGSAIVSPSISNYLNIATPKERKKIMSYVDSYMDIMRKEAKGSHFLKYEARMQKEARKAYGDIVPEVYAEGQNAFIQEYAGKQLGFHTKGQADFLLRNKEKLMTANAPVVHLDLHPGQILRKGARYMVGDWGLAVPKSRLSPIGQELHMKAIGVQLSGWEQMGRLHKLGVVPSEMSKAASRGAQRERKRFEAMQSMIKKKGFPVRQELHKNAQISSAMNARNPGKRHRRFTSKATVVL